MSNLVELAEAYGSLLAKTASTSLIGATAGGLAAEEGSEALGASLGGAFGAGVGTLGAAYQWDPVYRQILGDEYMDDAYRKANERLKGRSRLINNPVGRHMSRLSKSYEILASPSALKAAGGRGIKGILLSKDALKVAPKFLGRAGALGVGAGLLGAGVTQLGLGGEETTTPEPVIAEEGYSLPKSLALAGVTAAGLTAAGLGANALYNAYNAQYPSIEELSGGNTSLVGVR